MENVDLNEEGYLTNFSQWNKEIGNVIANDSDIIMTDRHWEVINYLQGKHIKEETLSIREIQKGDVIDIKEFYILFPGGPLKISTKIAGIPKPKSCI